jgi:putative serine protease PepD
VVWGKRHRPKKTSGHPYLGVQGSAGADECEVVRVTPDSPADEAGIKPGDVITKFDDATVANIGDLQEKVRSRRPGDEVTLVLRRGKQVLTVKVVIGKREE